MQALASENPGKDLTDLMDDLGEQVRTGIRERGAIEAHGESAPEKEKKP
jgi:hypothetical protein